MKYAHGLDLFDLLLLYHTLSLSPCESFTYIHQDCWSLSYLWSNPESYWSSLYQKYSSYSRVLCPTHKAQMEALINAFWDAPFPQQLLHNVPLWKKYIAYALKKGIK